MPSVRSRAAVVSTSSPDRVAPTAPPGFLLYWPCGSVWYPTRGWRAEVAREARARAAPRGARLGCARGRRGHAGRRSASGSVGRDVARPRRAQQDRRRAPHLSLASRRVRRAPAGRAVVLPEAAEHAERPSRPDPAAARRALSQLRGRARRRGRQADERRAGRTRVGLRVRLRARQRRGAARLPPRRSRRDAARQGPGRLPADRARGRHDRRVVARRRLSACGRT